LQVLAYINSNNFILFSNDNNFIHQLKQRDLTPVFQLQTSKSDLLLKDPYLIFNSMHTEKSYQIKPKSNCIYHFPISVWFNKISLCGIHTFVIRGRAQQLMLCTHWEIDFWIKGPLKPLDTILPWCTGCYRGPISNSPTTNLVSWVNPLYLSIDWQVNNRNHSEVNGWPTVQKRICLKNYVQQASLIINIHIEF